ncbi:MAG TPA: ABC transporter ATP-binding protein [Acidiferrobacterales bacterium]|nr:ABC transporter ATP-binding protein [Acidiferrobacterales bacterium]
MTLLDTRALHVAYGSVTAIRELSLTVQQGELVCLIGANGAGKSTTLKALAGIQSIASGSIHYDGHAITGMPAHLRVRKGIALVPEGRGIFARLTVFENLQLGAYARRDAHAVAQDLDYVLGLFPRLAERRRQIAGTLSGGEQQMLAIGRALMCRPRLLLLDEPSMGLAPLMVQKIFEIIRRIAANGVTLLLVEQNAKLALEVSDRGYVMESGRIVLADSAAALLANPQVQNAYLGGARLQ